MIPTGGFDDDDEIEFGPETIPLDGCPMLVQTSQNIKVLAQVLNLNNPVLFLNRFQMFKSVYILPGF